MWIVITASIFLAVFETLLIVPRMTVMRVLGDIRLILRKAAHLFNCSGGCEFIDRHRPHLCGGVLLGFGSTIVHNLTI